MSATKEFNMQELNQKKILSKAEAAFYIGISTKTLETLIDKSDFPAMVRIGFGRGRVFINREKLDKWLDEQDGSKKAIR